MRLPPDDRVTDGLGDVRVHVCVDDLLHDAADDDGRYEEVKDAEQLGLTGGGPDLVPITDSGLHAGGSSGSSGVSGSTCGSRTSLRDAAGMAKCKLRTRHR